MKINNEMRIGIMVSIVILLLIGLTFKAGEFDFSKEGHMIRVHFHRIDGVKLNAPVMLNGLEVGSVKKIELVEKGAETTLEVFVWIKGRMVLREGTKAYVKNMGFLGEKYIDLATGNPKAAYLTDNAIIKGIEPVDMDLLLQDGKVIAANLKDITSNVKERLDTNSQSIDRIVANLDTSMGHISSISANIDERVGVNGDKLDRMISNMESASANLDLFTYDLKLNPWKLLYRPKGKREQSLKANSD